MKKVLFLCTENACRSQMAEGLINHDLKGEVQAFSAGVRATRVTMQSLKQSLHPKGIKVVMEKGAIKQADFEKNPSKSNLILIGERPLEDWLQARTGQSACCGPCGDAECRTIDVQGKIYETIPAELIVKAGLIAAGQLFNAKGGNSCCP